jgi:molybdopterin-guanine dinucleotide biosynthesis protein A
VTPSAEEPLGALLTGGRSARMGRDKANLLLGGRTLARRGVDILARLSAEVVQVGGEAVGGLGIEHLADLRPGIGPAAGIETALSRAAGRPVVLLAVDLPFVPVPLLRAMLAMVDEGALIAAPHASGRWHPLCAVWAPAALTPLGARLDAGQAGLQAIMTELATPLRDEALAAFGEPAETLLNINRPEDLQRATELLRSAAD